MEVNSAEFDTEIQNDQTYDDCIIEVDGLDKNGKKYPSMMELNM